MIGTDNPDLTAFRDRGGKTIVWHGWADPLISTQGTVDYYKHVAEKMGGPEKTSQFMRLFMAPGVAHCGGGAGPAPTGTMEALIAWVEEGKAPDTLTGSRPAQGGGTPRNPAVVPIPSCCEVQRKRQHRRCSEFCLQFGILKGGQMRSDSVLKAGWIAVLALGIPLVATQINLGQQPARRRRLLLVASKQAAEAEHGEVLIPESNSVRTLLRIQARRCLTVCLYRRKSARTRRTR